MRLQIGQDARSAADSGTEASDFRHFPCLKYVNLLTLGMCHGQNQDRFSAGCAKQAKLEQNLRQELNDFD
jgi:hypothetical protein